MIEPVTFQLVGPPRGQQRTGGNGKRRFTQAKTRKYEHDIAIMAKIAMKGRAIITGTDLALDLRAIFPVPKSWSKVKRMLAMTGQIRPRMKPDLSNIVKSVEDAMNMIVYADDCAIVDFTHCKKVYGPQAMIVVTVKEAPTSA